MGPKRRKTVLPILLVPLLLVALDRHPSPDIRLASCSPGPGLDQQLESAENIFVGKVTRLSNRATWARVEVDDVWRGNVPAVVEVRGSPRRVPRQFSASSVDREFKAGFYLFAPRTREGEALFSDDDCTATRVFSGKASRLRDTVIERDNRRSDTQINYGIALLIGLTLAGSLVLARTVHRRKRRSS